MHQIGNTDYLSNLVTILNYNIKDQNFNETCNLEQSAFFKGDYINHIAKYSESSIIVQSDEKTLILDLNTMHLLKSFDIKLNSNYYVPSHVVPETEDRFMMTFYDS